MRQKRGRIMDRINYEEMNKKINEKIEQIGNDKFSEMYGTDQAAELRLICGKKLNNAKKEN